MMSSPSDLSRRPAVVSRRRAPRFAHRVAALLAAHLLAGAPAARAAQHKIDPGNGKAVCKVSVNVVAKGGAPSPSGFTVRRVHGGECHLAVSSDDPGLFDHGRLPLRLVVDGREFAVPHDTNEILVIAEGVAPVNRLWYGPVDAHLRTALGDVRALAGEFGAPGAAAIRFEIAPDGADEMIREHLGHPDPSPEEIADPKRMEAMEELRRCRRLVEETPKNALRRNALGEAYFALERHREAFAEFKTARECSDLPSDPVPAYNLAVAGMRLGNWDEAASLFEEAARLQAAAPEDYTLAYLFPEFLAAFCAYKAHRFAETEQAFTRLLERVEPTVREIVRSHAFDRQAFEKTPEGKLEWRGSLLFDDRAAYEAFVEGKIRLFKASPDGYGAMILRGSCRLRLGRPAEALQDFTTAASWKGKPALALLMRSQALERLKREQERQEALAELEKAGGAAAAKAAALELERAEVVPYSPMLYFKE